MNTNIDNFIKKIIPFLILLLLAYLSSVLFSMLLPDVGVNHIKNEALLKQVSYKNIYSEEKVKKIIKSKPETKNLNEFKLNAIYQLKDNSGWVILVKRNGETVILEKGEQINDYRLILLFNNHIIFEKNNKEFKLVLDNSLDKSDIVKKVIYKTENISILDKDLIAVKRNYLNNYISNINKIWEDITIKEIRKNGLIDGFQISRIKSNSDFEKIGLEKGDIIKRINNKQMKSYAEAFSIYNNIKNIDYLRIEILRKNNIMELNYEIN